MDYLEVTARKINTNGYLEQETLFVNKTSTGTLDTKVKLNDGYVATLISGIVYKGTLDKAKIGGKRLTVNGNTITITNVISNQTISGLKFVSRSLNNSTSSGSVYS